jgi:hypothetical protein
VSSGGTYSAESVKKNSIYTWDQVLSTRKNENLHKIWRNAYENLNLRERRKSQQFHLRTETHPVSETCSLRIPDDGQSPETQ